MEAEAGLVLPDISIVDSPQPPPGSNFPRPDFSEIISDDVNDSSADKNEGPLVKPTFKSALQAKKRLQAFSTNRPGSLPSSPSTKKPKLNVGLDEKIEETLAAAKKTTKKGNYRDDKAKAVIEEIEELKRNEQTYLELRRQSLKRSRSRSRSPDKRRFKKVDKKARNYRRRSVSPEKPKKPKKAQVKKYPRNWREFYESDSNFDLNRDFEVALPAGSNDILRQVLFESPSQPITPFKMKTVNREERVVPFEYIRFTRAKPVVPYSVNFGAIKEIFLSRKAILDALPKDVVASIEKLYSNSMKFKVDVDQKGDKIRNWYSKVWKDPENECKLLEKTVGLSFLQSYTGEEDNDFVDEEENRSPSKVEMNRQKVDGKREKDDTKKKKNRLSEDAEKIDVDRKKKCIREKSKSVDDADEVLDRKNKRKKDKAKKKERRAKEKKKRKKLKGKKKKRDKDDEEEDKSAGKSEKPSKQQVMEELKIIEEKLAKKREQEKSNADAEKEKNPRRKYSDREESGKETKYERQRRSSEKTMEKEKNSEEKEPKKPDRLEKQDDGKKAKIPPELGKKEQKKSRLSDEMLLEPKKKSRWSEPVVPKGETLSVDNLAVIEEIMRAEAAHEKVLQKVEELKKHDATAATGVVKETTPDTDEYHSHWESDDDVSSSVPRQPLKLNRSWESDEELFERTYNKNKTQSDCYSNLEIPLNIKTFSRRAKWDDQFKLLEEERRTLSEERKKLELEKQKILKLQEETKLDLLEEKKNQEEAKETVRMRSSTPEIEPPVKVKKEKCDVLDFSIDSLNNSLLSTVSSTESNYPIAVLENEYAEFIKAVSSDSSVSTKKKTERRSSSSTSSTSSSSDSDHKKKKRKAKMKKKKRKKKGRDCEGLLLGKGNIFNEFDIPVPSDLPEMVPTPLPVPSPIVPVDSILPLAPPNLLLNSIVDIKEKKTVEEPKLDPGLDLTKPFVFSSIVLPSKKLSLMDNSNLNLNDDSDSADFTDKFVRKPEGKEAIKTEEKEEEEEEETVVEENKMEIVEKCEMDLREDEANDVDQLKEVEEKEMKIDAEPATGPVEEATKNASPFVERDTPKEPPHQEVKPAVENEPKIKRSRSVSPHRRFTDKPKEKRRSRSRSPKRRSPIRRRELSPPLRRRYPSPRRRTPPRRRGSPRRRTPSPRRRTPSPRRRSPSPRRRSSSPRRRSHSPRRRLSPLRRRRRSPSMSPPRSRGGLRKRTPSPRIRRSSPLNSPLDGFKRSVADSTISDDMLPQPNPDDYVESPPSYGSKYYDRKSRKSSLSPQPSPKRLSLDDRINQVLGLEKNEPPKPIETVYPNYGYSHTYAQQCPQYPQYGQYGMPKNDYVQPYGPMLYTQPPPPIAKPVPTPTKVVQVGNILQVVPTEEIPPIMVETKPPERAQKIVQVGNMLQIVPAVIATSKQPVLDVAPPPNIPVPPLPEKQSAEAVMKQKAAERKAEREKRRQERERRRKDKEKKRKEKEKRKQMKLKIKTENMIKRAIQLETEALANDDADENGDNSEAAVQWPPVPVVVSSTPSCKGILLAQGGSGKRKTVQFADGVRPGEGTSPSGGEELSSPPPNPSKLPKEKRYKKLKVPKKSKKKKIKVKVVKRVQNVEEDEDDDEDDNLPPPSPPPGSPPPHVFPSRVKTHTINNVHQYVGNIMPNSAAGFAFRQPMPVVLNRHQPPPAFMPAAYPDVNSLSHPAYQGVPSHH